MIISETGIFFSLTKVDEKTRRVIGVATAEERDNSGEKCDYESTKPYYEKWSEEFQKATDGQSMGNLRVMHTKVAAGKLTQINYDDVNKRIMVEAEVVDDNEWNKVLKGVYTGFSQGGSYIRRWDDPDDPGVKRYTAKPTELSLVDTPCLKSARFEIMKSDGAVVEQEFQKTDDDIDPEVEDAVAALCKIAISIDPTITDDEAVEIVGTEIVKIWSDARHPRNARGEFTALGAVTGTAAGALAGAAAGHVIGSAAGRALGAAAGSLAHGAGGTMVSNAAIMRGAASGKRIGAKHGAKFGAAVGGYVGSRVGSKIGALYHRYRERAKLAASAAGKSDDVADLEKYSEDEPRDEQGRWTTEGGTKPTGDIGRRHGAAIGRIIGSALVSAGSAAASEHLTVKTGYTSSRVDRTADKVAEHVGASIGENVGAEVGAALEIAGRKVLSVGAGVAHDIATASTSHEGSVTEQIAARARNAATGAVAGALSGLKGGLPMAVFTSVTGGLPGIVTAGAELATTTAIGAAAGAVGGATLGDVDSEEAAQRGKDVAQIVGAGRVVAGLVNSLRGTARIKAAISALRARSGSAGGAAHANSNTPGIYTITQKISDELMDLQKMGLDPSCIVDVVEELSLQEKIMTELAIITNEDVAKQAQEMAREAGDESKWISHIDAARETLEKAAGGVSLATAVSKGAVDSEKVGVTQGWRAADGSFHRKKEDALAKTEALAKKSPDDSIDKILTKSRSLAGEIPPALTKADKKAALAKYAGEEVWDANRAMEALSMVFSLLQSEMSEGEDQPEQIAALQSAIDGLKTFIASEIGEDNSEPADQAMAMSEKLGELFKIGARHSAKDAQAMQDIHDKTVALGCQCSHDNTNCPNCDSADKSDTTGGLAKISEDRDRLKKALDDIAPRLDKISEIMESQRAEIEKLKKQPVPPPNLRVVTKGQDVTFDSGDKLGEDLTQRIAKMSPEAKAQFLIQLSQQTPYSLG